MDTLQRRETLNTSPNPDTRMDYVSSLEGSLPWRGAGPARISIRYVPDRLILVPDCLAPYLAALADGHWPTLESLATAILDDLGNEVVARWAQVVITAPPAAEAGVEAHSVMLEDRQPKWSNDALLSRLRLG